MAFCCHFEFEAKKKSELRCFEFTTTEGFKWYLEERWHMKKKPKKEGLQKYLNVSAPNGYVQTLIFYPVNENNPQTEDKFYVELRIFNPTEPFLGYLYKSQAMHVSKIFEISLAEYTEKFYLDNEHRQHLTCNINVFPLYHSQFIPSVLLSPNGANTIIPVKEEQMKKALKFLSETNPHLELEYLSDINLHCGCATFRVSRNVLSRRSVVFCKIFKNLSDPNNYTVTDVTHSTLYEMLYFIHTGHLAKKGLIDIKALFKAADLYKVNDLKDVCANYLEDIDCPIPSTLSDDQSSETEFELKKCTKKFNCDNLVKQGSVDSSSSNKIGRQEESANNTKAATAKLLSNQESTDNAVTAEQNRILKHRQQAGNSKTHQIIRKLWDRKNSAGNALKVNEEVLKREKPTTSDIPAKRNRLSENEISESSMAAEHSKSLKKETCRTDIAAEHSKSLKKETFRTDIAAAGVSRNLEEVFSGDFPTPKKKTPLKRE